MLEIYTDYNGREWVTAKTLSCGSYDGGAGLLGYANVAWLNDKARSENINVCDIFNQGNKVFNKDNKINETYIKEEHSYQDYLNAEILVIHDYNNCVVFVDAKSKLIEAVNQLENDLVFDESYVSKIKRRWIQEGQINLQAALWLCLNKEFPKFEDWWYSPCPALKKDNLWLAPYSPDDCFRSFVKEAAWEVSWSSPDWVFEYSNAHLDADTVYEAFKIYLFARLRGAFAFRRNSERKYVQLKFF